MEVVLEEALRAVRAELDALLGRVELLREEGFRERAEALETLEVDVLGRLDAVEAAMAGSAGVETVRAQDEESVAALKVGFREARMVGSSVAALRGEAEALRERLEAVDEALFGRLRGELRVARDKGWAFRDMIENFVGAARPPADSRGGGSRDGSLEYDLLDQFVNGVLTPGTPPEESQDREAGMVFFQKTPARVVWDLVERAGFRDDDVFCDIGSGLGQAVLMVHLLKGIRALGIERDPAFHRYACERALELGLAGAEFVEADARAADFGAATAFFLYTPFTGAMLEAVMEHLRAATDGKAVRVFTYGPCTAEVERFGWLKAAAGPGAGGWMEFRRVG